MTKSDNKSDPSKIVVPDLNLPVIREEFPPPRLTMDQYADWILQDIADETPQQREWRLNRPMPTGERFVFKDD